MSSAAEQYDFVDTPAEVIRRRIQRTRARIVNDTPKPKFRRQRRRKIELACKGIEVPSSAGHENRLNKVLLVEVKDALLGDPVCWKAELDEKSLIDSGDEYDEKLGNLAPSVSDGAVQGGASVLFFSASADPLDAVDPEVLELFEEDAARSQIIALRATAGLPRHLLRKMMSRPPEVDFDPSMHDWLSNEPRYLRAT